MSTDFRGLTTNLFNADGHENVLGKTTLIYGQNGSGKTTFSELLRKAHDSTKTEGCVVTGSIRMEGHNKKVALNSEDFPLKFAVYNRYYVEETLKLFLDGEGTSEPIPILHIGASSVAAQEQMRSLKALEGERAEWLNAAEETARRAIKDIKRIEDDLKEVIIATLNPGAPERYNSTRYRVTEVRKRLAAEGYAELSAEVLENTRQVACEDTKAAVSLPEDFPQPSRPLWARAIRSLTREVDTESIPALAEDQARSDWVEKGLSLHEVGDTCKFCREGVLQEAIVDTYRRHFNEALKDLRRELEQIIKELAEEQAAIEQWFSALPQKTGLLHDFGAPYEEHRKALNDEWETYRSNISQLMHSVRKRQSEPLVPLEDEELACFSYSSFDPLPLIDVLEQNLKACESQATRKYAAQQQVESHYAALKRSEYNELLSLEERANRASQGIRHNIHTLEQEYAHVRSSQEDTGPMALRIDSDLRHHFGHGHLNIVHSTDRTGYMVKRGNALATDLSEGERNAIAFLYFLASLESEDIDESRTVVVIDDPVTSLDRESLFAAFGVQTTYLAKFAQTILLTHDYEFFRLQMSHLESRYGKSQRRIRDGEEEEIAYPAVSVLEMKPTMRNAQERASFLRPLTQELLLHSSEYHYLFQKIVDAVQRNADDEYPLLGHFCHSVPRLR